MDIGGLINGITGTVGSLASGITGAVNAGQNGDTAGIINNVGSAVNGLSSGISGIVGAANTNAAGKAESSPASLAGVPTDYATNPEGIGWGDESSGQANQWVNFGAGILNTIFSAIPGVGNIGTSITGMIQNILSGIFSKIGI